MNSAQPVAITANMQSECSGDLNASPKLNPRSEEELLFKIRDNPLFY